MPDLDCHHLELRLLDQAGLTLLADWFRDPELNRRISAPTEQWFQYVTAEAGNCAWLAYEGPLPVGLVQLDICPDQTGSIALAVNPRLRSRGYGKRILTTFLHEAAVQHLYNIEACIEADNLASLRCFQAAGFRMLNSKPDVDSLVTYVYP